MTARLPLIVCLLFLLTGIRGQEDFSLDDAFDDDPTVEPTPKKEVNPTVKPDGPKPAPTAPKSNPKADDGPKPAPTAPKSNPKADDGPKLAPTAPKSNPKADDDLDLGDALGGFDWAPTKKTQPARDGGGGGGSFGDSDLADAAGGVPPNDPNETDGQHRGGEEEGQGQEKQSVIAGILSALGVAAVGAVSSFIAYQKKKLCFKGQAEDPENVNMDNQKGDQNDPQAQTNLLAK